jgi:hypothetical protein
MGKPSSSGRPERYLQQESCDMVSQSQGKGLSESSTTNCSLKQNDNNVLETSKISNKGKCQLSSIRLSSWNCQGLPHTSFLTKKLKLKGFVTACRCESVRGLLSLKWQTISKCCTLPPFFRCKSEKRLLTMWIGSGWCQLELFLLHLR